MVEKVRSKFLGSIAFFWLKVTVRTEVKCAAVVRVRSGACELDDDTKIAEEREVNKDAITFQRNRRRSQRSDSLPITNTSSATSHDVFPSNFGTSRKTPHDP